MSIDKKVLTLGPAMSAVLLTSLLAACAPTANDDTASTGSSSTRNLAAASSTAANDDNYEDGTYSAKGNYRSPAGGETVDVTLTLEDGVITDAEFTGNATVARSVTMQGKFAEGYEAQVVGKNIDDVQLTVVNGSSLTPQGFMNALAKIKAEASAS